MSFLESFRAIAAHEAEVLFFGAAGQHLWVLGADDIAGLAVEEGGNEADEIVARSPHHPRIGGCAGTAVADALGGLQELRDEVERLARLLLDEADVAPMPQGQAA